MITGATAGPLTELEQQTCGSPVQDGPTRAWLGAWPSADDATRLEQAIGDLLTNAAKYTEPGGRVTVKLEREESGAVLRVADTGRAAASAWGSRSSSTGYGQEEDRHRALAAGFDYHLVKPVDVEEVEKVVARFTQARPAAG